MMFEKFTERGRKVIVYAREEAERLQNDYLGTEHVLLGTLREEDGIPVAVLRKMGIDVDQIRMEVERNLPSSGNTLTFGDIPFTPRAKKVLEYAVEEARLLGHNYIGSEHLLLGLIREEEGIGGFIAVPFGLIIGWLTIRMGDLYVALVTLTFGLLMENLVFTLPSFVNQGLGLTLNRPDFATSDRAFSYLCLVVFAIIALFIVNFRRSTTGLALNAARWSEAGARTSGISVVQMKVSNRMAEAEWRSQLHSFSDEELLALNPEDFWGALLDRAERMKRAYFDEMARRKLRAPAS